MTDGPPETPKMNEPPKRTPESGPRWSQRSWVWFMLILLIVVTLYHFLDMQLSAGTAKITWTQFRDLAPYVKRIEHVKRDEYIAELKEARLIIPDGMTEKDQREFKKVSFEVTSEAGQERLHRLLDQYNAIQFKDYAGGNDLFFYYAIQILPFLLIIGIFWFMTSRVRKQMGPGIFGRFTGNRAKRYEKGKDTVTFADVAGLRNVKRELQEVVDFLKNPERFTRIGAKIPKGVLLVGPPGTGKTLLARAVAGEAGVPFYSISGSEFIELFVGVGASRVRELFDEAKKSAPCIIFIDEIDAVGRSRGTGLGGGHDEREQTLNQILSEMDGFESNQAVIVLAATNRPDVLDPALVRPGRFDRQVVVERPQKEGRQAILKVHTRKMPLADDVDLEVIARGTIGFSGADLSNLANEAALLAARDGQNVVRRIDFERAKDKIMLGTLRDEKMNERDRKVTAFHEAGHAILAMLLPECDPVHSVTIVPRGRALGVTQMLPKEEAHNYTRTYLLNQVVVALGGRAAEELVFQEMTTGAENDLERSSELVERMVCRWGMSDKLGPVSFRRGTEHVFLGRELGEQKTHSEHTAMLIDDEIRTILDNSYRRAIELLERERPRLDKLAKELLEKEVLTDAEIYDLLDLPMPESVRASLEARQSGASPAKPPAS
ncbi:MAG: ATP-dependent zinc metalloprotease FtsH, partial [Planctomycetes bacterium]|nr:ATP-dependent zinc metalloprotease FtsH [Planctomycetota bacterium]